MNARRWATLAMFGAIVFGATGCPLAPSDPGPPAYYRLIASGAHHTCAPRLEHTYASDHLICWGNNSSGQLGNGTTTNSSTPVRVSGVGAVDQLAAGGDRTCVIVNAS